MPVKVESTEIPDVLLIESPVYRDDRGYFTEVFASRNWSDAGLPTEFVQDNLSQSCRGTLRGLHYQIEPHGQGKLVQAVAGAVYDVAVDLRKGSPTYGKSVGRELRGGSGLAMWIPAGFAHGFIALEDDTLLLYKCSSPWVREAERSLAYNDPVIGIEWPISVAVISPKDACAPRLSVAESNFTFL